MYQTQERFAEAESQLTAAFGTLRTTPGADVSSTKAVVAQLEKLCDAWGKPREAAECRAKLPK